MKTLLLYLLLCSTLAFSQDRAEVIHCNADLPYFGMRNLRVSALTVKTIRKTPAVVNTNTVSFLLEVIIVGTPSAVEFEFDGASTRTKLVDNGTNGDKTANDGVYSLTVNRPSSGWNHDKVLGYIYFFENGVQQVRFNLFIELRTSAMPTPTIRKINDKIQVTDYIFNIVDDLGSKNFTNEQAIAKEFYKYHRDDYDFLNFILVPGYVDNRFHSNVRNSVQGIGVPNIDAGTQYGSAARLKGFNYAPQLSVFDGINDGNNHETGHQWINQAKTSFLKDGVPHMPASNIAGGIMGISIGGTGGAGGQFQVKFTEDGNNYRLSAQTDAEKVLFNEWELYLMGLIPASEVKTPAIIFKDQSKYPTQAVYPKTDFNVYTINDFIAQMGKRVPEAADSQKQFNMATIVVSERLLSEDEMAYLTHNLKRAESNVAVTIRNGLITQLAKPFRLATGDRATLRTFLNTNANCSVFPAKPTITSNTNFKFCEGSQTELSVALKTGEQAIWYFRGVPLDDRTAKITAKETTGGYTVNIRAVDGCNSLESAEVKLAKIALPNVPQVQSSNGTELDFGKTTILSTPAVGGLSYQWLKDNIVIANATQSSLTVNESGNYSLRVANVDGCLVTSSATKITIKPQVLSIEAEEDNQQIRLSPNPVEDNLKVEIYAKKSGKINISVLTMGGKTLNEIQNLYLDKGWNNVNLSVQSLPTGQYFILVNETENVYAKKFFKIR